MKTLWSSLGLSLSVHGSVQILQSVLHLLSSVLKHQRDHKERYAGPGG